VRHRLSWRAAILATLIFLCPALGPAQTATPIAGHYPPGQSGIRGAATPARGWGFTNFNRLFSNLEAKDPSGAPTRSLDEVRYANISMITWTTAHTVAGMTYGALAGIPFSTGNLNPSSGDTGSSAFGLGDVLVTPLSLYGKSSRYDYQLQFTVWTASGRFHPGSTDNRGAGYWALVYSIGGVAYPGPDKEWSLSAVARFEQNFEQSGTGIEPGDDLVVDWGVGRSFRGTQPFEVGISGFATWQLTHQHDDSAEAEPARYRYYGAGPEGSMTFANRWTFRLRAHWEFETRNAVQGNNLWLIAHCKI
jgi:hypothetical protein